MHKMLMAGLDVSRETFEKLRFFELLVAKWTPKINLISKNTETDIWARHILDSAQLFNLAPTASTWLDYGSGAGFPGIVIATILNEKSPDAMVTLIESDRRKCVFLKTAARELELSVSIISERIENASPPAPDVVSARAVASLSNLLDYSRPHLSANSVALFPKGQGWKKEVESAQDQWSFDMDVVQSITDDQARILRISNLQKR